MDRKKVLTVDDDAHVRLLLRSALGTDYTVLEASDGEEAVDVAHSQNPDIILMDTMMPKLDGIGACYILKSDVDTKAIPVIIVSCRAHPLDQEYSREMGADGYVTKPFNCPALLDYVSNMLDASSH